MPFASPHVSSLNSLFVVCFRFFSFMFKNFFPFRLYAFRLLLLSQYHPDRFSPYCLFKRRLRRLESNITFGRRIYNLNIFYLSNNIAVIILCASNNAGVSQKKNLRKPRSNRISSFARSTSFSRASTFFFIDFACSSSVSAALSAASVTLSFNISPASSVAFAIVVFTISCIFVTVSVIL